MATCSSGHQNPDGQRFCGECGAVIQPESERKPNAGEAALRMVTVDIELPGKSGVLRRTKFVQGGDEAPTSPPGWYPNPSGEPGHRYWDGSKWTRVRPSFSDPGEPEKRPTTSPLKVLGFIGAVILVLVGGVVLVRTSNRHTSSSAPSAASTTRRISTALTPDQKFVQDLNDNLGDELNPGKTRSDFLHWRYYHLEYADTGHEVCAYLASHNYSETFQQFKFKTGIGYPTDRDARLFVNIAIDDLCPEYSSMKPPALDPSEAAAISRLQSLVPGDLNCHTSSWVTSGAVANVGCSSGTGPNPIVYSLFPDQASLLSEFNSSNPDFTPVPCLGTDHSPQPWSRLGNPSLEGQVRCQVGGPVAPPGSVMVLWTIPSQLVEGWAAGTGNSAYQ